MTETQLKNLIDALQGVIKDHDYLDIQSTLDDLVSEEKAKEAGSINNEGIEGQIRYLLLSHSDQWLLNSLRIPNQPI